MKVFVDTNVLIDYLCKREPFFLSAKAVFASCFLGRNEVFISSLSVVNAMYIGRKYGTKLLRTKLVALSRIIEVVDLSAEAVLQTLRSDWNDYEDELQYRSALMLEADCIVTRNKKDFEKAVIPVYTADEFMQILDK